MQTLVHSDMNLTYRTSYIIILINAVVLTGLLYLWADNLVLNLDFSLRVIEFLKIIVITLIGLFIVFTFKSLMPNQWGLDLHKRPVLIAVIFILCISTSFYVRYLPSTYNALFNETHKSILSKIEPCSMLAYGTKADSLTFNEYGYLTEITWFPEIHESASNVSYLYAYDGTLPDYTFRVTYELPLDVTINTSSFEDGRFSKDLRFEISGNKKIVTYCEGQW